MEQKNFSQMVVGIMEGKELKQADLVNLSLLSKTTVSRIYRNSNDKGSTYQASLYVVMAVSIALRMTGAEAKSLFGAAFPEAEFWEKFLEKGLDIDRANQILYKQNLRLLGNLKE